MILSWNPSFERNGKNWLELATYRESDKTPGVLNLGKGIKDSNVRWTIHDHPEGNYGSEMGSMGMIGKNKIGKYDSDAYQAVDFKRTFPNYVYFPASKKLYNVTMYGIEYIKKINSAKDLKN
jgi:hypothetical protein